MIFSNFTRSESGTTILFKNELPIEDVGSIKFFKDNASGSFTKKEFRWSFNKNYWASWETLNQGNLTRIDTSGKAYLFLEVRYVVSGSGAVTSFSVNYQQAPAAVGPGETCDIPVGTTVDPTPIPPEYNTGGGGQSSAVNATTLCGESCDYYLWRPNHKGQQPISSITNLQTVLNNLSGGIQNSITDGTNEPGTGFGVYSKKSGQTLYFKRIDASGTLSISETDGVITLSSDASGGGGATTLEELTDVSVGAKLVNQVLTWDGNYWVPKDVSAVGVSYSYVDGSLAARDASITFLFDWNYVQDASITEIKGDIVRIDASIADLYSKLGGDSSIFRIENVGAGDASLFKETVAGIAYFRTIDGSGIINVLTDGDVIIISADASITGGIQGAVNIGGGDASIFSAIDPSGNIELRTIDGSGATTVITSGDKIIISTPEFTDDSSVKNIINIGSGPGEVLSEIDASGTAKLRTISGTGGISVTTVGDEVALYIDPSGITVDPCTWSDTDPISADVGGWESGEYVAPGSNSIQILEEMLYEYFPPNVTLQIDPSPGPTSSTGFYEKWVETPIAQGVSLTYSFNNSNFTKVRVYDVSIYENAAYYRTDSWGGLASIPPYTTFDISPDIGTASTDLTYAFKFVNKLIDGTIMPDYDTSVGLRWTDPYFYGTVPDYVNFSNINLPGTASWFESSLNKLIVPEQENEINYDVSANYVKIKFVYAYPATYDDLRSIFDVKNDFNVTTSFDSSILNVKMSGDSGPGPSIPYKVYIKSHWISFPPDVSTFKIIFNI